jgi:hypothetical protein
VGGIHPSSAGASMGCQSQQPSGTDFDDFCSFSLLSLVTGVWSNMCGAVLLGRTLIFMVPCLITFRDSFVQNCPCLETIAGTCHRTFLQNIVLTSPTWHHIPEDGIFYICQICELHSEIIRLLPSFFFKRLCFSVGTITNRVLYPPVSFAYKPLYVLTDVL